MLQVTHGSEFGAVVSQPAGLMAFFQPILLSLQTVPTKFRHVAVMAALDDRSPPLTRERGGTATDEQLDPNIGIDEQGKIFTFSWPVTQYETIIDRWQEAAKIVGTNFDAPDGPLAGTRKGIPSVEVAILLIKSMIDALSRAIRPAQKFPLLAVVLGGLAVATGTAVAVVNHKRQKRLLQRTLKTRRVARAH